LGLAILSGCQTTVNKPFFGGVLMFVSLAVDSIGFVVKDNIKNNRDTNKSISAMSVKAYVLSDALEWIMNVVWRNGYPA
jgi:hypothetical protein